MRLGRFLPLISLLLLGGCATVDEPERKSTSFLDRLRPGHEKHDADLIALDVALVEQPIYDTYLEKDLWEVVDERVGSLLSRGALQANGFRVGELGGITPSELLRMLTSSRSCSNPRSISLHSGGSTKLILGPVRDSSRFELVQDTEIRPYDFDKVQYELTITPTLTTDGRTCLTCTPQARHGEETMTFHPVPGGWLQRPQRQLESFPGLTWEVTVAPNQFVVIGGRMDMPDSLGNQCFIRAGESPPVRRLLVIRPVRSVPGVAPGADLAQVDSAVPALAIQAAQSAPDAEIPNPQ